MMLAFLLLGILFTGVPSSSQNVSRIAFTSGQGLTTLYVVDPVPGATPVAITDASLHARWPDWSPDGREIVFASISNNSSDVFIVNADGSNLREILSNPEGMETMAYRNPVWSPDGSRIAFRRFFNHPIGIANPDGTQFTVLKQRTLALDWTPEGRLVYSWGPIASMNEDETDRRVIRTFEELKGTNTVPAVLQVSPDGKSIAYGIGNSGKDRELWVMGIDGSNPVYLTEGYRLTWSPDSKRIAFNRFEEDGLFVMDDDGTNLQKLFDDFPVSRWGSSFSWSPWLDNNTAVSPATWGEVKSAVK